MMFKYKYLYLFSKYKSPLPLLSQISHKILLSESQFISQYQKNQSNLLIVHVGNAANKSIQQKFRINSSLYLNAEDFPIEKMNTKQKQMFGLKHRLADYSKILIYTSYGNTTSSRFATFLLNLGINNFSILDGGIMKKPNLLSYPFKINSQLNISNKPIQIQQDVIYTAHQIKNLESNQDIQLVDVRTYAQFSGKTSGYKHITQKGTLKNAVYGVNIEQYKSKDMQKGDFKKIEQKWKKYQVNPNKKMIFFCGRGFRATQAFIYSLDQGYKNIGMFSGIIEWVSSGYNLQKADLRFTEDEQN